MVWAIIKDGIVINAIVADKEFIDSYYPDAINIDNLNPRPSINWSYDGVNFTAPVIKEQPTE